MTISEYLAPAINDLDLSMIHLKLQDPSDGEGWSKQKCLQAEKQYKRFLTLVKIYPEEKIVPTKQMDTFWHYHILDTRKYMSDCNDLFGEYLHHFPYLGLRGDKDKILLDECFNKTKVLYKEVFGENISSKRSSVCTNDNGTGCSSGCNSTKCNTALTN